MLFSKLWGGFHTGRFLWGGGGVNVVYNSALARVI